MHNLCKMIKSNAAPIGLALAAAVAMAAAGRPFWKVCLVSGLTCASTYALVNAPFTAPEELENSSPPLPA